MRSSVLAAACAAALSLWTSAPLSAAGPDLPGRAPAAPCELQQPADGPDRPAWGGRFGEWLRRQVQRDGAERSGYYLRSPLLYAFGPDTSHDCEAVIPVPPARDCTELRVSSAAAARFFMELPLPQLGAATHTELATIIRAGLKNGSAVVVLDEAGHAVTLSPAGTRALRVDRCN